MSELKSNVQASLSRTFKLAIWVGVEISVKLHIDRGDSLDARDELGQTPLMLAAAKYRSKICKMLLDAGARLDSFDTKGRSALDIAIAANATDSVALLKAADQKKVELSASVERDTRSYFF